MIKIDVKNWNRKEHYSFFSKMDNPYFGLTTNLKITNLYNYSKENKLSLFSLYLHKSMQVVNEISAFKYRIVGSNVYEFDTIDAGCTILRGDQTFGFACAEFNEDFNVFNQNLQDEIEQVRSSKGLRLDNENLSRGIIRHTTIPWVSFTSVLHPTTSNSNDSIPRITFGKIFEQNGDFFIPVSVEGHHGLMDGYHIGQYFDKFQSLLNME